MLGFLKNIFKKKEKAYKDLNITDFKANMQSNAILVDVRTPGEYKSGKIVNSQNINVTSFDFLKEARTLDANKNILVYCKSGGRSARAANMLTKIGFKNVSNLVGGINAWQNKGEKIV